MQKASLVIPTCYQSQIQGGYASAVCLNLPLTRQADRLRESCTVIKLAQAGFPCASALNLSLATYGESVSRRVLYCCENSGGERKHIVRRVRRAMGCLSKSRKFFSSVRKEFRELFYIFSGTPIPNNPSPFVSAVSVALVSARRNARTSSSACKILQSK